MVQWPSNDGSAISASFDPQLFSPPILAVSNLGRIIKQRPCERSAIVIQRQPFRWERSISIIDTAVKCVSTEIRLAKMTRPNKTIQVFRVAGRDTGVKRLPLSP